MKHPLLLALALTTTLALRAFAADDASHNTLTDAEKAAGWKLLFNGKNMDGWHNFKKEGVRPGWQATNGTVACVDPHNAGDIVTTEKFGWFELELDFMMGTGRLRDWDKADSDESGGDD